MKFKNKLASVLFAFSALAISSGVYAANDQTFTVNKYNLTGATDQSYIKPEVRNELVILLKQYVGSDVTIEKIDELRSKLQAVLNREAKGIFVVSIPAQKFSNGEVELNLNFVAGKVNYGSAPGFSAKNTERSIPSLKEGIQFIAGRPWVDERELTMAVENPLKLTQVEYDIQPGKPVVANVNVLAPRGKTLRYVTLDNQGQEKLDYLRLSAGYINANLTDHDDVLSLALITNTKNFKSYYAFGGSYSLPLYKQHSRLDLSVFHSSAEFKNLDVSSLKLDVAGKGDIANINYAYYLPHFSFGYSNQLKLNAGYQFKRLYSSAAANGAKYKDDFYFVSPFSVGLTGRIIPVRGLDVDLSAKYNFMFAGKLGTSDVDVLRAQGSRLGTAEKFEHWVTGNVNVRKTFENGWSLATNLAGQYSNHHLVQSERFGTGVRGLRDGNGSGDSGAAIKTDLTTANLTPSVADLDVKAYAFADAGFAKYNRKSGLEEKTNKPIDEDLVLNPSLHYDVIPEGKTKESLDTKRSMWTATAGLGAKVAYKNFNVDSYVSYRLKGTDGKHDKATVWFSATYKW